MANNNAAVNLIVGINEGNAERVLQGLEQSLNSMFRAGNSAVNSVRGVGQQAQSSSAPLSTLARITQQLTANYRGLGSTSGAAASGISATGSAAAGAATSATALSGAATSATASTGALAGAAAGAATASTALAAAAGAAAASTSGLANSTGLLAGQWRDANGRLRDANGRFAALNQNVNTANDSLGKQLLALLKSKAAYLAITGAITSVTLASISLVREQMNIVDELTKTARIANTTASEIQKYKFGALAMGVEMDKLGDIFKDTQDKVGDFLTTGGGELADFFKYIAPQIGITAEQLRGLSGDKALGAIYNALQKSNIAYDEQVFYMESVADEASALIPVLRNNGEGFKFAYEQAKKYGAVLDENAIRSTQELKAATGILATQWDGMKAQIASALIPVVKDLVVWVGENQDVTEDLKDAVKGLIELFKVLGNTGIGLGAMFKGMTLGVGALGAAITNPTQALNIMKMAFEDIQKTFSDADRRMGGLANVGSGSSNAAVDYMVALQTGANSTTKAYEQLISTQKKLIGYAGDTGVGSTHVHIENDKHGKGANKYGAAIPQDILNGILVGGKPLTSYVKTSNIGDPRPGYQHRGIDFAGNGIKNGMSIESTLAIKSIKPIQGGRGGIGLTYTLADGRSFTIYHQTKDAVKVPDMYKAGGGKTGSQIQAQMDAAKEAEKKAKEAKDKFESDQWTKRINTLKNFEAAGGFQIAASNAYGGKPIDPTVLLGIMTQESGGDTFKTNKASGARGSMQFMEKTAEQYLKVIGRSELIKNLGTANDPRYDMQVSIQLAKAYMLNLLKHYKGDTNKAIYAYNGGEGRVDSRGGGFNKENYEYLNKYVAPNVNAFRGIGVDAEKGAEIAKAQADGSAEYIRAQQEATQSFEAIQQEYESFNTKLKNALEDDVKKIKEDGARAGKSQKEIDDLVDKRWTLYNRTSAKAENELKQQVMGENVSAKQKIQNEYLNSFFNINPELFLAGREKELETILDNFAKTRDIKLELLDITSKEAALEANKANLSQEAYATQKDALIQRRIKAENYSDAELTKEKLANQKALFDTQMRDINRVKTQTLLSFKHLQTDELAAISAKYAFEKSQILETDSLRKEKLAELDFLEKQETGRFQISQQEMKNAIEAIHNTELKNVNAKWDLESQRFETEHGRKMTALEQEFNAAQKKAEVDAMKKGKADTANDMLRGLDVNYQNPLDRLKAEYDERMKLIDDAEKNEVELIKSYADAKLDVEKQYSRGRADLLMSSFGSVFSSLTSLTKSFAGEQSKQYRVMFYAEKAFILARVLMNSWAAIAQGWATGGWGGALLASIQTDALPAIIQAFQPKGFMSGGYTGNYAKDAVAGMVHGQEYVLNAQATKNIGVPTLNALNSGASLNFGQPVVNIHDYGGNKVTASMNSAGELDVLIEQKVNAQMSSLADPNSTMSRMLKQHTTARNNY